MEKSQANIQGVFNDRVEHLNEFRRIMGDIVLDHHLITQDAEVMLLNREFDLWEDIAAVSPYYYFADPTYLAVYDPVHGLSYLVDSDGSFLMAEGKKIIATPFIKRVLFDKAPDMSYVQKTFSGYLVENAKNYPFLVQITSTDMPRMLNLGDRLKMGELVYEVRLVSPINRLNDSIQKVMVCPVLFQDVSEVEQVGSSFKPEVVEGYRKSMVM